MTREDKEKIQLIYHIFHEYQPGIKLLKLLKIHYLLSPCADFNKPHEWAYLRDGENNIIRLFEQAKHLIEEARKPDQEIKE